MGRFRIEREVAAAPAEVWKVLTDFGGISRWNPNLRHSRLLEGSPSCGVGATRQCDLADGKSYIRERIVDWQEGASYTVDIYDGTMPLEHAEAVLAIRRHGAATRVSMEMTYLPRYGWLGRVLDWLVLRWMMRRMTGKVLDGLAEHVQASAARAPGRTIPGQAS